MCPCSHIISCIKRVNIVLHYIEKSKYLVAEHNDDILHKGCLKMLVKMIQHKPIQLIYLSQQNFTFKIKWFFISRRNLNADQSWFNEIELKLEVDIDLNK